LFSREDVSAFINQHFEPAWETVRPVPIVRIDFGNGNVATRTLHGNVASYVCNADGHVLDILPGIYTPAAYTAALQQPRELLGVVNRLDAERRLPHLREYHRVCAQNLRNRQPAPVQPGPGGVRPANPRLDRGKGTIEIPLERGVAQALAEQQRAIAALASNRTATVAAGPRPRTAAELAVWQPLVADTVINETQRRLQIHDRLAGADAITPEQIKRWLYRDVLHADLDDPHMGLGDDFFADLER
jgi:hypothetical protein